MIWRAGDHQIMPNSVGATIGRPLYNYGKIMPLRCHLERSVAESKPEGQTATPFGSRRKFELSLKITVFFI